MYEKILEQLEDYCNCILLEVEEKDKLKAIQEMIHIVSLLTGWQQHPCETFLKSDREETIDIDKIDRCACRADGIMEFIPFYTPVEPESFKVSLVEVEGVKECTRQLDETEFSWGKMNSVLFINTLPFADQIANECNFCHPCPSNQKLVIEYVAGFSELPKCLLPIFCDMFHLLLDKNDCHCEKCDSCKTRNYDEESVLDTFDPDKMTQGQWLDYKTNVYLRALVKLFYKKQLASINLIGRKRVTAWGTIA